MAPPYATFARPDADLPIRASNNDAGNSRACAHNTRVNKYDYMQRFLGTNLGSPIREAKKCYAILSGIVRQDHDSSIARPLCGLFVTDRAVLCAVCGFVRHAADRASQTLLQSLAGKQRALVFGNRTVESYVRLCIEAALHQPTCAPLTL